MRMAGRFARRVRGWAAAHGSRSSTARAGERKHLIAEEYLAGHPGRPRGVHGPGGPCPGDHLGRAALQGRGESATWPRRRAFVNHYSFHIIDPELGPRDDQDVGPPALRGPGHPERPRARRLPRPRRPGISVREGRQLLHRRRRPRRPGPGRRHLVASRGYRASGPGLRPVDLHRVLVLRARPGRPGTIPVPSTTTPIYQVEYSRNLLFRSGRPDGRRPSTPSSTAPAARLDVPGPAHAVRHQATTPHQPQRPVTPSGSRDRDT